MAYATVAEIIRSDFVEGHHVGHVVALAPSGEPAWSVGAPEEPILPRSCNKPLQAAAMVRLGLDLPPDLLALAGASHSGEAFHLDGVGRLLATVGLDTSALQNIVDFPYDPVERDAVIAAGGTKSRVAMNCSGKHAAMLATCVVNGWPIETYLDPAHPLQTATRGVFEELTGERAHVAVDGCGAPLFSTSLTGLARAFSALSTAEPGSAEHRVAEAIRAHPEYVSGTRRDEYRLLRAIPGAIAKLGAEAAYAVALPDGRAWALKIADGADRARPVVMAAALVADGVAEEDGVDGAAVRAVGTHVLTGGTEPVGEIRATLSVRRANDS